MWFYTPKRTRPMENQENQSSQAQGAAPTQAQSVGFPSQPRHEKSGKAIPKWIFGLIGVVIIIAAGGFLVLRGTVGGGASPTPTGQSLGVVDTPTPRPTSPPTPSPEPVEKADISIEVLNGTGTPGEAGFLVGELEKLGFEDIEAGNADSQDAKVTTVTYSRDIPDDIKDEITERLEVLYTDVTARTGSVSGGFDIRIVTGPRAAGAADREEVPASSETDTSDTEEGPQEESSE